MHCREATDAPKARHGLNQTYPWDGLLLCQCEQNMVSWSGYW